MTQPSAPSYPQGPSSTAPVQKPGGMVGIWIGIVLVVVGIIGGIVLVATGASSLADGLTDVQRVSIDTGGTVQIDETGTYTVYAERRVFGSGTAFNSSTSGGFVPDVQVAITGPDGAAIDVRPSLGSETYTVDGYEGTRVGKFDADQSGVYTVRVVGGQSVANYDSIGIGKGLHLDGIVAILIGVFGGGAMVLLGIILIIVFAVKRSRSKRRIAQAANPYGSGVPGAGGGWPQGPAYAPAGGYPPAAGGYGAPVAPWQPPGQAPGQSPGWVPPPVSPGTVGSPTPAPAPTWPPSGAPAQDPPAPQAPPATEAAPPGAPTWQAPPPPAPSPSEPSGWPPPPPVGGTDEPAP